MKYAIRIPSKENLERDIAELLARLGEGRATSQWFGKRVLVPSPELGDGTASW